MSTKQDRERRKIIEQVKALVSAKLTGESAEIIHEFLRQFYQTVSLEELKTWSIEDLYGAALSFYDFIRKRKPEETKVRVYNPDFAANAWQSKHTIIEVITRDKPFLVDSLLMELNRLGYAIYITVHCGGMKFIRDAQGEVTQVIPYRSQERAGVIIEAPIYFEITRLASDTEISQLQKKLTSILHDVDICVRDWPKMKAQVKNSLAELDKGADFFDAIELKESQDYLSWVIDKNFIFLGCCDYQLTKKDGRYQSKAIRDTGYGILSQVEQCLSAQNLESLNRDAELYQDNTKILLLAKANIRSVIHRPVYLDSMGIPLLNAKGEVCGERIIIGMYTSIAYHRSTKDIPFLRRKVSQVMEAANFRPRSHGWKVMLNILETLPRDDLFQADADELLDIALGIYYLQERRRIRLFTRRDINGRFISCYVYVPRERFTTELLRAMKKILEIEFQSLESNFSTRFTDSVLARIHFEFRVDPKLKIDFDLKDIERRLIEVGRSWEDDIEHSLLDYFGEEEGVRIVNLYVNAFPASYREHFNPVTALYDVRHIERLSKSHPVELNVYKPIDDFTDSIRFKVYQRGDVIALSDALPILENMGLRIISERPYRIRRADGDTVWINDFTMLYSEELTFELQALKESFQDAFAKIWFQQVENDGFNQLVLSSGLTWDKIVILRAYAKYSRQIGVPFSQNYIEQTLVSHPDITNQLVSLFLLRFSPDEAANNTSKISELTEKIKQALDDVVSLDDDRILRHYLILIHATLRTNYFQVDADGRPKLHLSLKLMPERIPDLVLPRPMFEIFVYSPSFEGIHLRGSKVARGGLRWSDRLEDYRTEVLGLMKAQQVKNAVIVPSGAKGVFITKRLHADSTREEVLEEGIRCYKGFVTGLLDITDNIKDEKVVPPENVYRYDEDDTYLVVAADKGTATFSDIANSISQSFDFWLGDAFASGGSAGYDHKKMGITARGAWESVKRHFCELGRNIQETPFTCVGIGDMSGDVFGNGMLLSKHTKLIAAFNHLHIFIDPDPDPAISYAERTRLFNQPRSQWTDYDKKCISPGGGVYSRQDKIIELSTEARKALGLREKRLEPNKLISSILSAPVDLLWNGGIGTYVKSSRETNDSVGDRTNNATRVNANALRCKVVGEGGNLGFTQLARIEFCLHGGKIYTDFIDNAAGVDCSDHEVNIKILLNKVVEAGDMTEKQRNQLLEKMTDEVSELVLKNNYRQTQAISLSIRQAPKNIELHRQYISALEKQGILNRELEHLPDDQLISDRKIGNLGLVAPCIAVLVSYTKINCKREILDSDIPEDPYLSQMIETAFPEPLYRKFKDQLYKHSLRREIISTQISNSMINEMGLSFVYRLYHETGAQTGCIVRAYMICRHIFEVPAVWNAIEALDNQVETELQLEMMVLYIRLLRRSTRWILKHHRVQLDIPALIEYYRPSVEALCTNLPKSLVGQAFQEFQGISEAFQSRGAPKALAQRMAKVRPLFSVFDIVEAAKTCDFNVREVAQVHFNIDEQLEINWIRTQVIAHPVTSHWDALTRESLRDDLDNQQRLLTISILQHSTTSKKVEKRITDWIERYHSLVERWSNVIQNLQKSSKINYTMMFVAIRELLDLTQTSVQSIPEPKPLKGNSNDDRTV